jgi:hypothetical protein
MSEPRTEAGMRLLTFPKAVIPQTDLRDAILAIEAEAAGLDVERLTVALRRLDERIVREHPETATQLLLPEDEPGRRDYAAAIIAEYAALVPDGMKEPQ